MSKEILKTKIKESVSEVITEMKMQMKIRQIIRECINESLNHSINEEETKDKDGDYESANIKRNTVMKLLRNNKLKDSQFAYSLWHPKDQSEKDTYRSLFSKKVHGEPDADGNIREFTDEEISQLYELLRSKS